MRSRLARLARAAAAGAVALAATGVVAVAGADPAEATSYRFWSYWHGAGGGWAFSPVGAAARPADGAVEGWRFAVSPATGSRTPPRAAASFDAACEGTAAVDGRKRVALVVDFGTADDAPPGQRPPRRVDTYCAVVASTATGYQVLQEYAAVRAEAGLVCAIAGYPAGECGAPVVARPTPTPTPTAPRASARPTATSAPARSTAPPARTSAPAGSGGAASSPSGAGAPSAAPTEAASLTAGAPTGSPAAPTPVAVAAGGLPPTAPDEAGAGWLGALAGAAAVAALGTAAMLRSRRGQG